jgi:hypothetical protein
MVREALRESSRSYGVVTRVAGQLGLGSETLQGAGDDRRWAATGPCERKRRLSYSNPFTGE